MTLINKSGSAWRSFPFNLLFSFKYTSRQTQNPWCDGPCEHHTCCSGSFRHVTRLLRRGGRGQGHPAVRGPVPSSIFFRAGILLVGELGDGEAEDGGDPRQLTELLPGHVQAGEDAHGARVLLHAVHQPHVPAPGGHLLVPEELVADEQRVDGHGLVGLLHVLESVAGAVGLVLQHLVEVVQGLHFPGSFRVRQAAGHRGVTQHLLQGVLVSGGGVDLGCRDRSDTGSPSAPLPSPPRPKAVQASYAQDSARFTAHTGQLVPGSLHIALTIPVK